MVRDPDGFDVTDEGLRRIGQKNAALFGRSDTPASAAPVAFLRFREDGSCAGMRVLNTTQYGTDEIPLYAAPPAPAVARVLDEWRVCDVDGLHSHNVYRSHEHARKCAIFPGDTVHRVALLAAEDAK